MIVSIDEVLERKIVRNRDLGDYDGLVEPEGAAIDVRVGEIWKMVPDTTAFLNKVTRKTRQYIKVAGYKAAHSTRFILEPLVFYQFKTIEKLKLPQDLMGRFNPRYNLWVNGILVFNSKADPGYEGPIGVPVINLSGVPFEIELGCRFGQFEFHQINGKTYSYRGQWKGERLYTEDEEVQV